MPIQNRYEVGTLIKDKGKIGVIYRTIETGTLKTKSSLVNWRFNYEIYYFDGGITIMGHDTLRRLIEGGDVNVVKTDKADCVIKESMGIKNEV